ncbi:hypothetical protein I317_00679 [Kwoniella heveanensis CBS 569]|nr:hypothetical protein I317_00679 [Kwoniella heveanensis CBS 569]
MKYLLNFLEGVPDAPSISDPEFQQLLVDVQAGKSSSKSNVDAFYDSLEKIVNELKSTPESVAFQKPVSKRDAPDYYEVIKKPMDLTTILRNVKARKYKSKADFESDLNLIWSNCFEYNSQETHPIRAAARFMKQKADHHLEFLLDKNERAVNPLQSLLSQFSVGSPLPGPSIGGSQSQRSPSRFGEGVAGGEEDAAGESDDAQGEDGDAEGFFRDGGSGKDGGGEGSEYFACVNTRKDHSKRGMSVTSTSRSNNRLHGSTRRPTPPAFRPQLNTSLDTAPALVRTPYTMTHFLPVSLSQAGPSFSEKGKAKEILYGNAPPAWYPLPAGTDDEDIKLEGYWWGAMNGDDAYVAGLPAVPAMVPSDSTVPRRRRLRPRSPRKSINGTLPNGDGPPRTTSISPLKTKKPLDKTQEEPKQRKKPVSVKKVVHRTVGRLHDVRQVIHRIHEFQRIENEGGILPSRQLVTEQERTTKEKERAERAELRKAEKVEVMGRKRGGGEVGEEEAALCLKRASAGLLAHAGFEGANETALDLFTRAAVDHLQNMGRTFRLLLDGFSNKMTSEEIVLHALHQNGQVQTQDLETYLKDDIEREETKVAEMQRKIRQAFKEVTTAPVIEDDMMFANNGEMLTDGNFADELGEDFLGLRDLGIDKEFGLSSLTVPSSLFYGRRKRFGGNANGGAKEDALEYPPPPPFIPLNATTLPTHLPALLHSFYATRIEAGLSIAEDDAFDPTRATIGSLGQIVVKNPPPIGPIVPAGGASAAATGGGAGATKKKRDREGLEGPGEGDNEEKKKKAVKKPTTSGVGKGNWIRPNKEEKARRAAEKAALVRKDGDTASAGINISINAASKEAGAPLVNGHGKGGEVDAEGEVE